MLKIPCEFPLRMNHIKTLECNQGKSCSKKDFVSLWRPRTHIPLHMESKLLHEATYVTRTEVKVQLTSSNSKNSTEGIVNHLSYKTLKLLSLDLCVDNKSQDLCVIRPCWNPVLIFYICLVLNLYKLPLALPPLQNTISILWTFITRDLLFVNPSKTHVWLCAWCILWFCGCSIPRTPRAGFEQFYDLVHY